jgi:hypothetical protein
MTEFQQLKDFNAEDVQFSLRTDSKHKIALSMHMGTSAAEVAFVSPACVTQWPRCTGDGNFGTLYGPDDIKKAKFCLDLTDQKIGDDQNRLFTDMCAKLEVIDDKLLEFMFQHQQRILHRKNLSKEEVKMLQIRSVRMKYDKNSGAPLGNVVQLNTPKYAWDGMGGKFARKINVCDHVGQVIEDGVVTPGDVVAATVYCGTVYNGVGGDKFGIQWSFRDVSIVCQRWNLESKSQVTAFAGVTYDFATNYEGFSEPVDVSS